MNKTSLKLIIVIFALAFGGLFLVFPKTSSGNGNTLNQQLRQVLDHYGFTGLIGRQVEQKLVAG